jgi:hypothetical protein
MTEVPAHDELPRGDDDQDVDQCDGYVVLVADPRSGGVDCYGPYRCPAAADVGMQWTREELDAHELHDVVITVARWHRR